jgi:NADH/NAD ratio-sensing transcriptional regulator Rex
VTPETNTYRNLPNPTLERLAHLYVILGKLISLGTVKNRVSSRTLSELMGVPDHTIRKDISLLKGERYFEGMKNPKTSQGYLIEQLRALIGKTLGLIRPRTVCIVGLGNMGTAILNRKIWGSERGVLQLVERLIPVRNRLELPIGLRCTLYHARDLWKQWFGRSR